MKKEKTNEEIKEIAEQYYFDKDFYCSESVLKAVLEGLGKEVPHEVLAMSSGFSGGGGGTGCTCGALNGGVMAIGYFFGRSHPKGEEITKSMALSKELYSLFKARHKCTCCYILTRGMEKGDPKRTAQCVKFTGEMALESARIIRENL